MLRKIYTFLFFLSVSMTLLATPEIVKVDIVHASCPLNGSITISVSNTLGQVQYELERVNAPEGEVNFTKGPHSDNFFGELPPGEYVVKVYDASTGASPVVKTGIIIEKKYDKVFAMNVPSWTYTTGVANNQYCVDNGVINASGSGGTRPYYCKIVNTTTGDVYEKEGTASGTSIQFTGLPDGDYSVEMKDQCGTGALYGNLLQVRGSGTVLSDTKLTGFVYYPTGSSTYFYGASSTDCSQLSLQMYYYYGFNVTGVNQSNNSTLTYMNRNYNVRLQYRVEYPLGTYSNWMVANSYATFPNIVKDYDPTIDQLYRIQVRNPCRPDSEILTSETFTIPKINYTFSVSSVGPIYRDFCNIPSVGGCYLSVSTSGGLNSYTCGNNFDVVVTTSDGTFDNTYSWPTGNTYLYITDLPLGKTYTATIKNRATGSTLSTHTINLTSVPVKPLGIKAAALFLYETGYNYGRNCDFNTHALYTYLSISTTYLDYSGNYHSINASNPITYSIEEAPDNVSRAPITGTGTRLLWTDLPDGTYKIKVDYGCRSEIFTKEIKAVVTGFDAKEPTVENTGVCDNNKIRVQGFFHKNGTAVTNYTYNYYDYYYYARAFNSQGVIVGSSGMTASNSIAEITGLASGKYTVKFYAYQYLSPICYYDKQFVVDIPKYYAPSVDISQSGGISCTVGGKANFTVSAVGSNSPFKYRIKVKDASDDTYSNWQTGNVFPDLYPGRYTVQIWNTCSAYITQDLTLYDSGQQFVGLVGYVGNKEDGAICKGKEAKITVLSIGPVHSYQWFKDEVKLTGQNGPEYVIPSASDADKGEYKVLIYNGSCYLESSVKIIDVLSPAATPTLSASDCIITDESVLLTSETTVENPTYQWFRNGEIISGAYLNTYKATKPGVYQVTVTPRDLCPSDYSNPVTISLPWLSWKNEATNRNWNDIDNWLNADEQPAETLPCASTSVYIRTGARTYPSLLDDADNTPRILYGNPICDNITFEYGAEIAYPHLLSYQKARIQYNWGYYNSFAGAVNKQPEYNIYYGYGDLGRKKRDQWHALAAPLKKMASGDFSFAGYPMSWQASFNAPLINPGEYQIGDFSKSLAKNDIDLSTTNNAIVVKVALYNDKIGFNNHKNLEGLRGILEIPYFENAETVSYHEGHSYDPISQISKFYYFNTQTLQPIYSSMGTMRRGNEAYRFIYENEDKTTPKISVGGNIVSGYSMKISRSSNESSLIMVGNPFVSSINSEHFYEANAHLLAPRIDGFHLYSGTAQKWILQSYSATANIAPLQAFVIRLKDGVDECELLFPLEGNYALTGVSTDSNIQPLSRRVVVENSLYVKLADNNLVNDYAVLNISDETDSLSNVEKIINPENHSTAEIFFMSSGRSSYNQIQFSTSEANEIGIGVKSSDTDTELCMSFDYLSEFLTENKLQAILVDKEMHVTQDLIKNNQYNFRQRPTKAEEQYTDLSRFVLRLSSTEDYSLENDFQDIRINYKGELLSIVTTSDISKIDIYNLQGRRAFNARNVRTNNYCQNLALPAGVYIVNVQTIDGQSKVMRIISL